MTHTETPETPEVESAPLTAARRMKRADLLESLAEGIRTVLIVIGIAIVIRVFIFQPYRVEGASMLPRFTTNDHLIVDKLSYRFTEPHRGDIIVFKYPRETSIYYVKRIIGLPGERVSIKDNTITITKADGSSFVLAENAYLASTVKTNPSSQGETEFSVAQNSYFVLGDNRPASSDSREWGLLPKEDIIGRVILQTYPLKDFSIVKHASYTE